MANTFPSCILPHFQRSKQQVSLLCGLLLVGLLHAPNAFANPGDESPTASATVFPKTATHVTPLASSPAAAAAAAPLSLIPAPVMTDHELTTVELTSVAVGMLLKRARALEATLLSDSRTAKADRLDPQAERSTLEGLSQSHLGAEGSGMTSEAIANRLEAARLDLKLLRSRHDILAYRATSLETQITQQQDRLSQVESEYAEGRRLEEEGRSRRMSLASQTSRETFPESPPEAGSPSLTLRQVKVDSFDRLLSIRKEHLAVLGRIRTLLRERITTLGTDRDTTRDLLNLAEQSLKTATEAVARLEAQADRINLQTQEKRAREAIERARQEQVTLNSRLEELEKSLLESRTASGTTARRAVLAAQREALLSAREAAGENLRLQEFDLRRTQELGRLSDVQRHLASAPLLFSSDRSIGIQLATLGSELDRERTMSRKRRELLAVNRTLVTQSVQEAETRKSSDGGDNREEIRQKQRQLSSIDEAVNIIASQEALLTDLQTRVADVQKNLERAIEAERERELFSRRTLRFETGFPQSLLTNLGLLPGATITRLSEGLLGLSGSNGGALVIALLATLFLVLSLRRIPHPAEPVQPALPGLEPEPGQPFLPGQETVMRIPPWRRLANGLLAFAQREAVSLGCALALGILLAAVPLASPVFLLPCGWAFGRFVCASARAVFSTLHFPLPVGSAILAILGWVARLLPPILLVRSIDLHPEVAWVLELSLKIALLPHLIRLLAMESDCREYLQDSLQIRQESHSLPLFGKMYRLAAFLMLAAVAISLVGYENLGLWLASQTVLIFLLLALATLARPISDRLANALFAPGDPGGRLAPVSDQRAQFLFFISRKGFRLTIWLMVSLLLLHRLGVSTETPAVQAVLNWFGTHGEWIYSRIIRILIILAGVAIVLEFTNTLGESIITYVRNEDRSTQSENERRASTLVQIVYTTIRVGTFCIAGIMILREMGMDITPLLTGAGIVGVAVGFGSQSLVKDFFSGFFILVENQFRVGDVIEIGGKSGLVEKINLKTTVLRGTDGSVYIIPNGEITSVKNMTYAWSRAVLDIGVGYDTDVEKALSLLQVIGDELQKDPSFADQIIERPEVLGVERLDDSAVVLRMLVKTRPLKQWTIGRAFRRKILEVFAREGIEIPFPQRVVSLKVDDTVRQALESLARADREVPK